MAIQFKIKHNREKQWAEKVDIPTMTVSEWTEEESAAWVSALPEYPQPPTKAYKASTVESLAYLEKKKEWDRKHSVLEQIARHHSSTLVQITATEG